VDPGDLAEIINSYSKRELDDITGHTPLLELDPQLVAHLLRTCGAAPDLVPADLTDATARKQWLSERASLGQSVPLWVIDAAAAILATVMGGCAHSRLQDLVFGGATIGMLNSMTVPVLMSH
jgi:nucleotide-binding universal stress UspA family protein